MNSNDLRNELNLIKNMEINNNNYCDNKIHYNTLIQYQEYSLILNNWDHIVKAEQKQYNKLHNNSNTDYIFHQKRILNVLYDALVKIQDNTLQTLNNIHNNYHKYNELSKEYNVLCQKYESLQLQLKSIQEQYESASKIETNNDKIMNDYLDKFCDFGIFLSLDRLSVNK